ncbi:MAG TPA: TonB family protein [Arenimonas sp.]|uniref:energy transducer TonB n=1 Tax=Arenimonas sp. TaxID=1872635 RepID=UPI002D7F9983|nr:TonB family protein [Arenimonas sp.]HEU0152474.1 TonB family protein [Arenimonas sp.]
MVTHSLPQPQPSPFAAVDAKRIAGNTLALVLHAAVFAVLLVPSTWTPPAKPEPKPMTVLPTWVPPVEIEVMPAPPTQIERPRPRPDPSPQPVLQPVAVDPAPVVEVGSEPAYDVDPGPPVEDSFDIGTPQVATLAYDVYPAPRYPRQALRSGATGTVLLRVLVDEQGRPQEVVIETSSGHRELDRAARDQVLAKWRFHPATHQGRAIRAYALVPIGFDLP